MCNDEKLKQLARAGFGLSAILLLAGCSPNLASIEDTYVPASIDENYPIKVVQQPVRLVVQAGNTGLRKDDIPKIGDFAKAALEGSSPIVVSYPSASASAKAGAEQAAGIMRQRGISRHLLVLTPESGRGNAVTMTFAKKAVETKPCGDWSQSIRASQQNDSGPNFGCAFQQNIASMIANPDDLVKPRPMPPAQSNTQSSALTAYQSGEWTTPAVDSTF